MGQMPGGGDALPVAHVYRPTAEEWADPGLYLCQMACEAVSLPGGVAKVVPPGAPLALGAGQEPSLMLSCQLESVGCLASKWTQSMERFWADDYGDFCLARRLRVPRRPRLAGVDVDTFALFSAVVEAGGWRAVDGMHRWPEIAARLQVRAGDGVGRLAAGLGTGRLGRGRRASPRRSDVRAHDCQTIYTTHFAARHLGRRGGLWPAGALPAIVTRLREPRRAQDGRGAGLPRRPRNRYVDTVVLVLGYSICVIES